MFALLDQWENIRSLVGEAAEVNVVIHKSSIPHASTTDSPSDHQHIGFFICV